MTASFGVTVMRCSPVSVFILCVVLTLGVGDSDMYNRSASDRHCSHAKPPQPDPADQLIKSVLLDLEEDDCELADPGDYPRHYSPVDGEEFDFIVVGAGSAGSVVASRLSEEPGWTVLLLEAGGDPTKTSEIPKFFAFLEKTPLDWQYRTNPNENNCLGYKTKSCDWPKGKVLGGTSTINGMFYNRGNRRDYDQWAAEGNEGWGYEDVLPYFKKSEDMRAEEVLRTPRFKRFHDKGGYQKVERFPIDSVEYLVKSFGDGSEELGYERNPDANGIVQPGFVTMQGTLKDGRRCSTAKAFLSPARGRNNLKVSKHSTVTKILIDDHSKTAYGVEFIDAAGITLSVLAKKEVILSAGTVGSPQILMLSGIGPRKHLNELNIKVVADLPVGENLQDPPLLNGIAVNINFTRPPQSVEKNVVDFLLKRKSSLTELGLVTRPIFISTVNQKCYPDMELFFIDYDQNVLTTNSPLSPFDDDIVKEYSRLNAESFTVLVAGSLLRPYSRGKIQLNSANPLEYPNITSGYLTDHRDVETFLRTYDFIYKLMQTKGVRPLNPKLHEIKISGCSHLRFASNEYRECSLRYLTTSSYHPCCTCKMGPERCRDSVVDPQLRVKGVERLRVIDASAMPRVISGHPNAVIIMIAERGSDLIKETWSQK